MSHIPLLNLTTGFTIPRETTKLALQNSGAFLFTYITLRDSTAVALPQIERPTRLSHAAVGLYLSHKRTNDASETFVLSSQRVTYIPMRVSWHTYPSHCDDRA